MDVQGRRASLIDKISKLLIPTEARNGPVAVVDLSAVAANYRTLAAQSGNAACAAVIKGDGYGVGMLASASACQGAGARRFFVARFDDGLAVREALPDAGIAVLDGLGGREAAEFEQARLCPVLGDLAETRHWLKAERRVPCFLHIDTGMNRLGLTPAEVPKLANEIESAAKGQIAGLMTHFVSSDDVDLGLCAEQVARFRAAIEPLPRLQTSIVNSSGLYLDPEWRADFTRPGKALAGINPLPPGEKSPVSPVMSVYAPILQIREVRRGESVGYSEAFRATRATRIATVGIGYANGYLRSLSARGIVAFAGRRAPLVGRVSMDLITVDVTAVPETALSRGMAELLGPTIGLTELSGLAGSNEHELQIALGRGCQRVYLGA